MSLIDLNKDFVFALMKSGFWMLMMYCAKFQFKIL